MEAASVGVVSNTRLWAIDRLRLQAATQGGLPVYAVYYVYVILVTKNLRKQCTQGLPLTVSRERARGTPTVEGHGACYMARS